MSASDMTISEFVEKAQACSRWSRGWTTSDEVPNSHIIKAVKRGKVDPGCVPINRLAQGVEEGMIELDSLPEEVQAEIQEEIEESAQESNNSE